MNLSIHDYKLFHEQYMENHNGTTISETIFLTCLPPLVMFNTIFVNLLDKLMVVHTEINVSNASVFVLEFLVFILPLIMSYTILSSQLFIYPLFLLMPFAFGWYVLSRNAKQMGNIHSLLNLKTNQNPRPFITYFRTLVNLVTAICILAVDFTVFPRRFAKTESFGFGLMDTGVGLFVVSNAIVVPLKSMKSVKTNIKYFVFFSYTVFMKNICLLFLGAIRFFTTDQINYHTHVTEYGVHWNFFFTLAFVNIICTILTEFLGEQNIKVLTLCTVLLHEGLLQYGLQAWVMHNSPRNGVLALNKEGVSSILGYVSLYWIGLLIGQRFTTKNNTITSDIKIVCELLISAMLTLMFTCVLHKIIPVSRKLANTSYCSWITTLSLINLALTLLIEMLFTLSLQLKNTNKSNTFIPLIVKAVSYNGLAFFILSNLFTGIINLSVHTLHISNLLSVSIVSVYMFIACGFITVLYIKAIKINLNVHLQQ